MICTASLSIQWIYLNCYSKRIEKAITSGLVDQNNSHGMKSGYIFRSRYYGFSKFDHLPVNQMLHWVILCRCFKPPVHLSLFSSGVLTAISDYAEPVPGGGGRKIVLRPCMALGPSTQGAPTGSMTALVGVKVLWWDCLFFIVHYALLVMGSWSSSAEVDSLPAPSSIWVLALG